jgi:ubiquinone/menaquinone biosynthesis C-methylase UbiE
MNQHTRKPPAESPAKIYEYYMVPAIFTPWVPALLGLAAPRVGERVLDVACGTGVVARQAVSQVGPSGRVVGLDMNPHMLEMARAREPSVEWKEGNAQALPFSAREFDIVSCQQGLQFFPEPSVALHEMHRVLVPGGRLALALWCEIESSPGHYALAQGLERHVGPEAVALMYAVFRLGDAETIHTLLRETGFCDVRIRRETRIAHFPSPEAFTRFVVVGSVLGRTGVQVSDEALAALISEVHEALKPYVQRDGLAFPMEAHLAAART